ncbi:MAG: carboxypeptidase-like regulatory domain-containing protein [Gemmatimonadota bacterium]
MLPLLSAPPAAQEGNTTIAGTVRAAEDGRPLAAAVVRLQDLDRQILTGQDGRFVLEGLPAGAHTVEIRLLGFAPARRAVELSAGEITRIEIALRTRAIELPELEVEVERSGFLPGFVRRMKAGHGHFLTAGDIAERNPTRLTDMLRQFPEARVRFNPTNPLASWTTIPEDRADGPTSWRGAGPAPPPEPVAQASGHSLGGDFRVCLQRRRLRAPSRSRTRPACGS